MTPLKANILYSLQSTRLDIGSGSIHRTKTSEQYTLVSNSDILLFDEDRILLTPCIGHQKHPENQQNKSQPRLKQKK